MSLDDFLHPPGSLGSNTRKVRDRTLKKRKALGVKRETEIKQAAKFEFVMHHSTAMRRPANVSHAISLADLCSRIDKELGRVSKEAPPVITIEEGLY